MANAFCARTVGSSKEQKIVRTNNLLFLCSKGTFLNIEKFIADRISNSGENKSNISKPIVKIGIIGITLGISVMLLTVSIVLGFKREITSKITGLTAEVVVSSINLNSSNEPAPILIPEQQFQQLKALPFVKHIQKTAFKNGILKTNTENEGLLLKGVDAAFDFTYLKERLIEGKLIALNDTLASNEVMVSKTLADKLDLKVGEKLLVYFISQQTFIDSASGSEITKSEKRSRNFKICGIFKTDFADFDDKLTIVDLKQIQRLNYWQNGEVGSYEIKTNNFENLDQQVSSIEDIIGYNFSVNSVRDLYYNIFVWLDKLDINGVVIIILMILVATINMITALLILILERTTMVGLLKTLGMPNVTVKNIFLWIGLRLIGRGMLYGNLIGIGLCYIQLHFKLATLDPQTYYVDYVAVEINWLYFLWLNLGTFLICNIMLLLPALIISKLTPIKTLKFD